MLFINFLCLLYLMVLSNCHTISKSIDNDPKIDGVPETVTSLDLTRPDRTRYDKANYDKFLQKYRREEKSGKPNDRSKATKLLIVPPKKTERTSPKTTTENVKYKSQKRKAGGFWRKFRGKDKKTKHNYDCKYNKDKERSIPKAREYGWWKHTERRDLDDTNPRKINRKNRNAFVLLQSDYTYVKRDAAPAADKKHKTVTSLQIGITPHMVSMTSGNSKKFKPVVKTQTLTISTSTSPVSSNNNVSRMNTAVTKNKNNLKNSSKKVNAYDNNLNNNDNNLNRNNNNLNTNNNNLNNNENNMNNNDNILKDNDNNLKNIDNILHNDNNMNNMNDMKDKIAYKNKEPNNMQENMSSMLARMTSQINDLKKMYKIGYYPAVPMNKAMSESTTSEVPDFTGTAQIEELLNDIKVKAMQMVAENTPAVTDLITNSVTETTFEVDPLLTHLQLITSAYLLNDNKLHDVGTVKESRNYQDVALNASIDSDESDPHNIVTRSFKDDTITIAHNVEDMLQRELKYIYRKVKNKVSNEYTKEMKKASKALKATTKKIIDELKKAGSKPSTKCKGHTTPKLTTDSSTVTTISRHSRGTKSTKKPEDNPKPTATYDDYVMLTLYEQMLEKTHQNNVMKMLATADFPVEKRWSEAHTLSKRNPDIKARVELKQDSNKLYEDGYTTSDYNYIEPSISTDVSAISDTTEAIKDSYPRFTDSSIRSSFDELSSKISYNDFVNGYKHYLKFQKEQANQNFSAMVKYQAHRHHSVDDIGKYILDKIPQLPNFESGSEQARYKRFFDDSDLDDQEISTKSDDSWFKKHFYFFIDSGPPKKFHTSQTVPLKSPGAYAYQKNMQEKTTARKLGPGPHDNVYIQIGDDSDSAFHSSTTDVNLAHLTRLLDNMKRTTLYNLRRPSFCTINTFTDISGTGTETQMITHVPINIVYKIIGNKRRRELLTTPSDVTSDIANRFKRENTSSTEDIAKRLEVKGTTEIKRHLTPITHSKPKPKNKMGYVDINLIPKQTAVVKLRENSTKKNKFKDFFKKFYFKNMKSKKKSKRSSASRLPRFNPFKKIKNIFKAKPDEKGTSNSVRAMPQNLSDYDMLITHIDTFKPIKYDKLLSPQDMQKQIPNISEVFYGDLEMPLTTKAQTTATTKSSLGLLKLDENYKNYMITTEKQASTARYGHGIDPTMVTTPSSTMYTISPLMKEDTEVMSINVKTLSKYSPTDYYAAVETTPSGLSLADLDFELENIAYKLKKTKEWTKGLGYKRTTFFNNKMISNPVVLIRRPIEDLTIDSKMTRVAKFPITHISHHDIVERMMNNDDYISVQDEPMSSEYLHESRERSAASTDHNLASRNQNAAATEKNTAATDHVTSTQTKETAADSNLAPSDQLDLQYVFKKQDKKPIVKVMVQKAEGTPNKTIYFDYFNDLLMWHNDILNLEKVPNVWSEIIGKHERFTTPNVNNLYSELKNINLFLEKNPRNLDLLPTPRYKMKEYDTEGVIRSVGLNDKAVVSSKDFLIEGEAKYYQYNRPPKNSVSLTEKVTETQFRPIAKQPSKYVTWIPSGYGIRTPGKAVYRIPYRLVSKMANREVPTEKLNLLEFADKLTARNILPFLDRCTATKERPALNTERLSSFNTEQPSAWYATKPIGEVAERLSTWNTENAAWGDAQKYSTWEAEKGVPWGDAESFADWIAQKATAWDAERAKALDSESPTTWDTERISWGTGKPVNWHEMRPLTLDAERPSDWDIESHPSWDAERPATWNVGPSHLDEKTLDSNAPYPPDANAARPVMWDLGPLNIPAESAAMWPVEKLVALDPERSNISMQVPVDWGSDLSPFWTPETTAAWGEEKVATLVTEPTITSLKKATEEPMMWMNEASEIPWTPTTGITNNIFSIADIYFKEKLRAAAGNVHRYGRLPTMTYTRPFRQIKGVRRNSKTEEAPGAVMMDTTLLAYDDEVDTVTEVYNVKKLLRNSDKSSKFKTEFKKEKASTDASVTKINKQPPQFYTTPLPMKPLAFDKFLKEQGMDVEYVTAPLYDIPPALNSFSSPSHKSSPIVNIKQLTFLQTLNNKNKTNTKDIQAKAKMKNDHKSDKTKHISMKFSKTANANNLKKLISTTKALNSKAATNRKDVQGSKKAKTSAQNNEDLRRVKRFTEFNYNTKNYPIPDIYSDYDSRIKKATKYTKTKPNGHKKSIENNKSKTKLPDKVETNTVTNKDSTQDLHYKDVEITIINFDNTNKVNRAEYLPETSFSLDDVSEITEVTDFTSTEQTYIDNLHNKLLYDNILKEIALYSKAHSNVTEMEHAAVFTEPSRIHKPFGILYNLHRHEKNPHRVHISNHHYEYDIYFDNDKKSSETVTSLMPSDAVSLPAVPFTFQKYTKMPSYTSNIVFKENEIADIDNSLEKIMDKNRYAKNVIQERFNLLKLLNLSPTSKTTPKKTHKSTTTLTPRSVNLQNKRDKQRKSQEAGFSITFTSSNDEQKKLSTVEVEDQVYDMAHSIADMLKFGTGRKASTVFDEVQHFDASKAYSQNAESASLLALSEKYDNFLYLDNYFDDSEAGDTTVKVNTEANPKELKFNLMDLNNPSNISVKYYNQLEEAVLKYATVNSEDGATKNYNNVIDGGFIKFVSSNKFNNASKNADPERVYFKVVYDDYANDGAKDEEGFFKIISGNPNDKGVESESEEGFFKIISNKPKSDKYESNAEEFVMNKSTLADEFKYIDPDLTYNEAPKTTAQQENDFFKNNSPEKYDNAKKCYTKQEKSSTNSFASGNANKETERSSSEPDEGFFKFVSDDTSKAKEQHTKVKESSSKYFDSDKANKQAEKSQTKPKGDFFKFVSSNRPKNAKTHTKSEDESFFTVHSNKEAGKPQTTTEGLLKFIAPEELTSAKKSESTPEVDLTNVLDSSKVTTSEESLLKFSSPAIFSSATKSKTTTISDESFLERANPNSKAEKLSGKQEEDVLKYIGTDEASKATEKYTKAVEVPSEIILSDAYKFEDFLRKSSLTGSTESSADDSIETPVDTQSESKYLAENTYPENTFDDWHWPISIPIKPELFNKNLVSSSTPITYQQAEPGLQMDNTLVTPPDYQPPVNAPNYQTPTPRLQIFDPDVSSVPTFELQKLPLSNMAHSMIVPRSEPWICLKPPYLWSSSSDGSKKSKTQESTELDSLMSTEGVYVEAEGDNDEQTYYENNPRDDSFDILIAGLNKKIKEVEPPIPKNRKRRDTTANTSKEDLINRKRAVSSENTYTAKDVAALEVIVDLMKNTLSYEEKDIAGVFNKPMVVDHAMKSIHQPHDSTNSIQVHIAIPYDTQNGKKRSPLEPIRVRKVFSAKMSTPVDLEYQVHSFESAFETTGSLSTVDDGLSPGMYLLVDKPKNGYALKPVKANIDLTDVRSREAAVTPTDYKEETTRRENIRNYTKVTLSKNFIAAVNRQLVELYENLTKVSTDGTSVRRKRHADYFATDATPEMTDAIEDYIIGDNEKYRIRKKIDWEAIKKYFGHDRVCNCKCRVNKTMCRACAASDAVMDELIFEFDNLGQYMRDHCTEIQTYFWMNPNGGLKLRNAVHRIDKSLNDYYKRVKGKCKGRPCERLNIYIDKRQFVTTDKVSKEDVGTRLLNDLTAVADDVAKTCEMQACLDPRLKERGDVMMDSIKRCISQRILQKRSNLVTKKKLVKNVYSLDNINVNIICKPDAVAENYEATTTITSPHILTNSKSHYQDGLYSFDMDETHQKYKKRKGFKHLFPRRKKKDRIFTYYTIPDEKPSKTWFKRDTNNQIDMPLLADSGGTFWFDYLKGGSTTEPRIARQTFQPNLNKKLNIEVVQTKDLITKKAEKNRHTDFNTIYMTVRTSADNIQEEADVHSNKLQRETDIYTLSTDTLTQNINQLLELFGNINDLEKMNMNSNRSTMFLKSTTKQVVKMKPCKTQNVSDELPQLPDLNNSPYATVKGFKTKTTETTTRTTEYENTKSLANTLEDLEKKIAEIAKNGLSMSSITGQKATTADTKTRYEQTSEYTTTQSSLETTDISKVENVITTHATNTETIETTVNTPKEIVTSLPVIETKPVTESTTREKATTQTTKSFATQAKTLQTYTAKTSSNRDKLLSQIKQATLRFLGFRNSGKTTKARSHTSAKVNIGQDNTATSLNLKEINIQRRTTQDSPTIVIINEYDNQLAGEAQRSKHSDDYKNLLLSIIQYETNRLNNEWQRIAYGSERDDNSYRRSPTFEKGGPVSMPLDALVPNIKDTITTPKCETTEPSTTTTKKHDKIIVSIPELQLPEPKDASSKSAKTTKKPSGLLNKIVSKIGMRVVSAANKRKEKAAKQSYLREVRQKAKNKTTLKPNKSVLTTEASDAYPPSITVCDLQATFDRVKRLRKELVEKAFEEYVKDIPCYKYKRLHRSFFVNYRSGGMKWDWIRNKRSPIHNGKFRPGAGNFDDAEETCDVFETFVKGEDNIYRISSREKRSAKIMPDVKLQWIAPPKAAENDIFVMLGDSTTLDCIPRSPRSRLTAPQPQYSWQTDRKDMLDHDNVQVDGYKLVIWKAGPRNGGRYTCSLDNMVKKVITVYVVTLPAFDVVFLPTYKIRKECTYEDLKAIQHLGRVMTKEASCGNVCSIRIDEPMCQMDRATNRSLIRSTAVLTMSPRRIKCSVQCRQNLLSSLVRLAAANVPALTKNEVVISRDGVNETLRPCMDAGRPMTTHMLRKKDSGGHHEYHKLSSLIEPGKMHVVIICHAGYYLLREQRICAPCPCNTSSSIGDNTCTPCPPGTVSEPGASKCHAVDIHPRRYDWWWYPSCGYVAACAFVLGACCVCVVLSLLMHMVSRGAEIRCDRLSSASQQRIAQVNSNVVHERYVHTSRARPLSPSRVILARFFRPSLTSSRGTAADSQETRFEQWKERNIPPPLPPIDFDVDTT